MNTDINTNLSHILIHSELNEVPNETIKTPGFCTRLADGTANCVKRFGHGVAAAGIGTPLSVGIVKFSQLLGYVPNVDLETMCKLKPIMTTPLGGAAIGVILPIAEEILFRGLLQDVMLTRIPKYIVKKVQPGKEIALDTKIAKAVRILLTAALFAAVHKSNEGVFPESYVKAQLVSAFVGGIGLGILQESKPGLLGGIGAHIANNMTAIAMTLYSC